MNLTDIEIETLVPLLLEDFQGLPPHFKTSMTFVEDLGMDSIELLELVQRAEQRLGIIVPDNTFDRLKTVQDLIDYAKTFNKLQPDAVREVQG